MRIRPLAATFLFPPMTERRAIELRLPVSTLLLSIPLFLIYIVVT